MKLPDNYTVEILKGLSQRHGARVFCQENQIAYVEAPTKQKLEVVVKGAVRSHNGRFTDELASFFTGKEGFNNAKI